MHISNECAHCSAGVRSRRREFSDQIWSVLITWGEVDKSLVMEPICDDCYNEFRETLIDRANELEMALADPAGYQKIYAQQQKQEQVALKKVANASTPKPVAAKPKPAAAKSKPDAKSKVTPVSKKKKSTPATKKKASKKTTKKTNKKEVSCLTHKNIHYYLTTFFLNFIQNLNLY